MQDLLDHIASHRDEYLAQLYRLCRQPSISAQGTGIAETARLVQIMLDEAGAATQIVSTSGHPIVYGTIQGAGTRTLSYYNHYDVQPVDPLDQWKSDPF